VLLYGGFAGFFCDVAGKKKFIGLSP